MTTKEKLAECRKTAEYKEFLSRQRAANKSPKRQTKKEAAKWSRRRQRRRVAATGALSSYSGLIVVPAVK